MKAIEIPNKIQTTSRELMQHKTPCQQFNCQFVLDDFF